MIRSLDDNDDDHDVLCVITMLIIVSMEMKTKITKAEKVMLMNIMMIRSLDDDGCFTRSF